jgi:predicted O-methyltransferase YrrM
VSEVQAWVEEMLNYHEVPEGVGSNGFFGQRDHPMRSMYDMAKQLRDKATIEQHWTAILKAIPSRAFRNPAYHQPFGFRRGLAVMAHHMKNEVRYLEVGCRLGHSLAAVCLAAGDNLKSAHAVDAFIKDYDNEANADPEQVLSSLADCNIKDLTRVTIHKQDSHKYLRTLARGKDKLRFNLICVDGDHTLTGARQDLEDCFVLLDVGGILVFDDVVVKGDRSLLRVWHEFLGDKRDFVETTESLGDHPGWVSLVRGRLR